MKLVIDIEEAIYKECIPYKDTPIISNLANYNSEIIHAIANGTPQPEKRTEERTKTHACDCISRQAVRIALLNKGQHSKRYKLGETWELNLMEIEEAIEELPSVEPERKTGKWIPCSERLPEPDTFVLTYHRHLSFDYQYVSSIDETTGEWSGFCGNLSDEVLAWMPLPDAYEGETT